MYFKEGDISWGLRYVNCGIKVFFVRYFGNFLFSYIMYGIAVSSSPAVLQFFILLADGIRSKKILHGTAVPFICAVLSNTGQYNMQHKTHVSMVHVSFTQFLAVDLQCDCHCSQWPSFSIFVPVNRGLRLLKMLAGPLRLMDVTLSKRNRSYTCGIGILSIFVAVFTNFSYGIAVLVTPPPRPQCPPL